MITANTRHVLEAVNDCRDKGQRCIAYCLVSCGEGDLALADCANKVHERQAICAGFSYLLAANSEYLKAYYRVCEAVCGDCTRECRKHNEHHQCRAPAEAREAVVEAIKLAFAAAAGPGPPQTADRRTKRSAAAVLN